MSGLTEYQKAQKWLEGFDWDNNPDASEHLATICEALQEIEKIKAKQEQGLLIPIPSRDVFESEGDTVYYIFDYEIAECINCGISLDAEGVMWITLGCDEHIFPYREPIAEFDTDPTDWCLNTTSVKLEEWGETVFLTHSEAEEALVKMGGK